jgi:hypothetical protein
MARFASPFAFISSRLRHAYILGSDLHLEAGTGRTRTSVPTLKSSVRGLDRGAAWGDAFARMITDGAIKTLVNMTQHLTSLCAIPTSRHWPKLASTRTNPITNFIQFSLRPTESTSPTRCNWGNGMSLRVASRL